MITNTYIKILDAAFYDFPEATHVFLTLCCCQDGVVFSSSLPFQSLIAKQKLEVSAFHPVVLIPEGQKPCSFELNYELLAAIGRFKRTFQRGFIPFDADLKTQNKLISA